MRNYYSKFLVFFRRISNYIPLLDRWILLELLPPLLFAISAFTVVSVSVGVMFDLVRKIVEFDLPLNVALNVLILRLPSFVVLSFPMATLLASLLTYSKLSSNSELKALRAVGISIYRVILPSLFLALVMTGLTFVFNNNIVPFSNSKADYVLRSSLGKSISIEKGEDIIYSRKGTITDSSNKNSLSSIINNNLFPTISDALLAKGKKSKGFENAASIKSKFNYYEKEGDLIFKSNNELKITNEEEFARKLQLSPKKFNNIDKIFFDLEKNIEKDEFYILNLRINNADAENKLEDSITLKNIKLLRNLLNKIAI